MAQSRRCFHAKIMWKIDHKENAEKDPEKVTNQPQQTKIIKLFNNFWC